VTNLAEKVNRNPNSQVIVDFIQAEGSLKYSQNLAIGIYPDADEPNLHPCIVFFQDQCQLRVT
jgi:hypothetical protein